MLLKKMFKYVLILLVTAFLAISLLAGVMIIFRDVSIFGMRFVSNKNNNAILLNTPNITKINIETNNYDVLIMPNSEEDLAVNTRFRVVIENNFGGFSTDGLTETLIEKVNNNTEETHLSTNKFSNETLSYFVNNGEFTFKLKEPTGLVWYNNSRIAIYLPENLTGVEYNIKTNKGEIVFAKNNIHPNNKVSTSNINIHVNSLQGSMNLDNVKMEAGSNLTVHNYIGRVEINNNSLGNVIIDSNQGNFMFKNIGYDGFNGGNLTVTGNNPYVSANKVYGNVTFNTTTGFIKVNEILGDSIMETDNGIIRIGKLKGGVNISNNSGETTINQIGEQGTNKSVIITGKTGYINLGAKNNDYSGVYYLTSVTTESGRVKIENMNAKTVTDIPSIRTTSGSVSVDYKKNDIVKDLNVSTKTGAITLNNVYGNITAKTEYSSKITVNFYKVSEVANITTDNGEIEIGLPAASNSNIFNLNLKNKQNKLNIALGNYVKTAFEAESKDELGFYTLTQVFPTDKTTTNTINVKTISGKIIVKEII